MTATVTKKQTGQGSYELTVTDGERETRWEVTRYGRNDWKVQEIREYTLEKRSMYVASLKSAMKWASEQEMREEGE